jgi:hypothetical protein
LLVVVRQADGVSTKADRGSVLEAAVAYMRQLREMTVAAGACWCCGRVCDSRVTSLVGLVVPLE